jgi:hypothetical protein
MPPEGLKQFFTVDALNGMREPPGYAEAIEGFARGVLREFDEADASGRWMFRDLGRSSIYLTMVFLDRTKTGLTAFDLAAAARVTGMASRGRVMAFIRHAQGAGELIVPAGSGPWTQRRLTLTPVFIERFRKANGNYARMAARIWPELSDLTARLADDQFLGRYVAGVALASQAAVAEGAATPRSERLFLERDCGMLILFRLLTSQSHERTRLLDTAPLSRARLSREFGVSRAHINRLLGDAASRRLLNLPATDTVVFSPSLSDDVERMIGDTLQITRAALLVSQSGQSTCV